MYTTVEHVDGRLWFSSVVQNSSAQVTEKQLPSSQSLTATKIDAFTFIVMQGQLKFYLRENLFPLSMQQLFK